jgi:hypothetical protein
MRANKLRSAFKVLRVLLLLPLHLKFRSPFFVSSDGLGGQRKNLNSTPFQLNSQQPSGRSITQVSQIRVEHALVYQTGQCQVAHVRLTLHDCR